MATAPPATSPSCGQQPLHRPRGPSRSVGIAPPNLARAREGSVFNLICICHIQAERLRLVFMPSDKIVELPRIARRCHYAKSMRQCRADKLPAEASRAASDEPNGESFLLFAINHSSPSTGYRYLLICLMPIARLDLDQGLLKRYVEMFMHDIIRCGADA